MSLDTHIIMTGNFLVYLPDKVLSVVTDTVVVGVAVYIAI